ncbi:MAG TPA: hypothetical protein VF665_10755 [Longimicrobium sp.]|uniref:hypothetical protein n=1 Tax=Longimicrobium sp. TaxID=2029185 RepID=UPI002ED8D0B6
MPKWLKLGIVGAGAGAVAFLVRGQLRVDKVPNPPQKDAAVGAAAGFILLGGGALLYDLFCPAPSSGSWRPGLCGN